MEEISLQLKEVIKAVDNIYFSRNERDFAYELYSKMRLMLLLPPNVEITPESTKKRFDVNDDILQMENIRKYFLTKTNDSSKFIFRYPDLLVHQYATLDKQLLVIEVKKGTVDNQSILKDLAKLIVYCKGRLKYEKGILIIVNPNRNRNLAEISEISRLLIEYPEVEIWIVRPDEIKLEIINSTTF